MKKIKESIDLNLKVVRNRKESDLFQCMWANAWISQHYADETNIKTVIEHHDKYKNFSSDFLARINDQFVGTVRLVWDNNEIHTPIINDFELNKVWSGKVAEVTLFTISDDWRDRNASVGLSLYKEAVSYAKFQGASGIIIAADHRVFRLMKFLKINLTKIGEEKIYEGSLTVPAYHPL